MKEKTVSRSKAARRSEIVPRSVTVSWALTQREDDEAIGEILFILKRFMATVRNDLNILPLETAISLLQRKLKDETHSKETRSILHHHLRRALLTRYCLFGCIEDLEVRFPPDDDTPIVVQGGLTGHDIEADEEVQSAIQLIHECQKSIDTATLDDVISIAEESIKLYTEGKQVLQNAELLILLGNAVVMRYLNCLGDLQLDYAAEQFREAEYLCRGNVPLSYISLMALSHVEMLRASECGSVSINGTFGAREYAEKARAIDQEGATSFQIGKRLAEEAVEVSQIQEAITHLNAALRCRMPPHPQRLSTMSSLANALMTLFNQGGDIKNLEDSITLNREGSKLPISHPGRALWLNNLANALVVRFWQKGAFEDLEESIGLHRAALDLRPPAHPNRSDTLNNLANNLELRFKQKGTLEDLEECIGLHREALELQPSHRPNRYSSLSNLATALLTRYEEKGAFEDLEECFRLQRDALDLCPTPHPGRSTLLGNLADAHTARFKLNGALQDLEESIRLHREALESQPPSHLNRFSSLNKLAGALATRYERQGTLEDLEECIRLAREALDLTPSPRIGRSSSLNNLAGALEIRFKHKETVEDLEECMRLREEALRLTPPSQSHLHHPTPLAGALTTRFQQKGAFEDLGESIQLHREAPESRPCPHLERRDSFDNLAGALETRSDEKGALRDLEESTRLHLEALDLQPPPRPNRLDSPEDPDHSLRIG